MIRFLNTMILVTGSKLKKFPLQSIRCSTEAISTLTSILDFRMLQSVEWSIATMSSDHAWNEQDNDAPSDFLPLPMTDEEQRQDQQRNIQLRQSESHPEHQQEAVPTSVSSHLPGRIHEGQPSFPEIPLAIPSTSSTGTANALLLPGNPFTAPPVSAATSTAASIPFDVFSSLPGSVHPLPLGAPGLETLSFPQPQQQQLGEPPGTLAILNPLVPAPQHTRSKKRRIGSGSTSRSPGAKQSASPDAPDDVSGDGGSGGESASSAAITARREAHRQYTQKSREKVNTLFRELLEALPEKLKLRSQPSKADILSFTVQQVHALTLENTLLKMKLALTSTSELKLWIQEQTKSATTVRDACHPITELFCIGLHFGAAEMWALDSRSPGSLGQAWNYLPPSMSSVDDQFKAEKLKEFLRLGEGMFFATNSNEPCCAVFSSETPVWIKCGESAAGTASARTSVATEFGISGQLLVPLRMYDQVIVACFYARGDLTLPDEQYLLQIANRISQLIAARYRMPGAP
jgi:hypothetical protein